MTPVFLEGAVLKLAASKPTAAPAPADAVPVDESDGEDQADVLDDVDELPAPQPCVLCGQPARQQVEG
ncbi:hypothetical protein ACIRQH_00315 [Streptomyces sp. NPDC102279]|uniref:hypothetical protein n=1 Tax=Streptomyces sp. NPDC102279 TaxID=3366153 RepID=UPI003805FEC6